MLQAQSLISKICIETSYNSAERVFMMQLNPNDRFFLLKDNLMVIKRNNSLSQQFKVVDLGVDHKAGVTLLLCKSKKTVQL